MKGDEVRVGPTTEQALANLRKIAAGTSGYSDVEIARAVLCLHDAAQIKSQNAPQTRTESCGTMTRSDPETWRWDSDSMELFLRANTTNNQRARVLNDRENRLWNRAESLGRQELMEELKGQAQTVSVKEVSK